MKRDICLSLYFILITLCEVSRSFISMSLGQFGKNSLILFQNKELIQPKLLIQFLFYGVLIFTLHGNAFMLPRGFSGIVQSTLNCISTLHF